MGSYRIGSLEEFRDIVAGIGPEMEMRFLIEEDIPLDKARAIWRAVSQEGGEGAVANPDILVAKAEAWDFVRQKLRQLERWGRHVGKKADELEDKLQELKAVLEAGGPGVLKGFEAQSFDSASTFLDSYLTIGDAADLEAHIDMMKSQILDAGAVSNGPEDAQGYYSVPESEARQVAEQEDISEFNFAFLKMKQDVVETAKEMIELGVKDLTTRFLSKPTNMGSSTAEFLDVPMYRGEMMGE